MRTTSQLSKLSGVSKRTLQYWSQDRKQNGKGQEVGGAGILLSDTNPENGYRLFPDDALAKILMIKLAKDSGCSQLEIQEIMDALNAGIASSMERRIESLVAQREEIDRKIRMTQAMDFVQQEFVLPNGWLEPDGGPMADSLDDVSPNVRNEAIAELVGLAASELLDCFAKEAPDTPPNAFARALTTWLSGGYAAMLLELCLGEGVVEGALDGVNSIGEVPGL